MRIGYFVGALRGFSSSLSRSATYQALSGQPGPETAHAAEIFEEETYYSRSSSFGRRLWAPVYQRSTYYWISFICNCILVLFGYVGWAISEDRDASTPETKNTARFIIAGAYSFPSMATTGLLLFWHGYRDKTRGVGSKILSHHVKLSLFSATNNALTVLFMIVFVSLFDDPSGFGSGDDLRNILLPLIIILATISFFAVMTAAKISYSSPKNAHGQALVLEVEGVVLPPMISPWILGATVESSSPIEPEEHTPVKPP